MAANKECKPKVAANHEFILLRGLLYNRRNDWLRAQHDPDPRNFNVIACLSDFDFASSCASEPQTKDNGGIRGTKEQRKEATKEEGERERDLGLFL